MTTRDEAVIGEADNIFFVAVQVNHTLTDAIEKDFGPAAVSIGEEADAGPHAVKCEAGRVISGAGVEQLAAAGFALVDVVAARPALAGAGVRQAIVKEGRIFLFVAGEAARRGRCVEGSCARRGKSINGGVATIAADLQQMRSRAQAVKREGARDGNQRVVQIEGGFVHAVDGQIHFAASVVSQRLIGDRIAGEGEPGSSRAAAPVTAAAGVGIGDIAPAGTEEEAAVGFLKGAVGVAAAIVDIEVIELDVVVAGLGSGAVQGGHGEGVGAGAQAIVDEANGRYIPPVQVKHTLADPVNKDFSLSAIPIPDET